MRRGFSLRELIVVVAILVLLAAIGLPVVAAARESGKREACLANLRQIALGMRLYDDSLDGASLPELNAGALYLGQEIDGTFGEVGLGRLRCPDMTWVPGRVEGSTGYSMNGCLVPRPVKDRPRVVEEPAATIAAAESAIVGFKDAEGREGWLSFGFLTMPDLFYAASPGLEGHAGVHPIGRYGALRHSGKGHYAMVDGHVVLRAPTQIRRPKRPCGAYGGCQADASGWQGPGGGPHFALIAR